MNPDNANETFSISFVVASNDSTSFIIPGDVVKSNFAFLSHRLATSESESILLPAAVSEADAAVLTKQDSRISAEWKGTGASFLGISEVMIFPNKDFTVKVNTLYRGHESCK
jgi:hypothetical protein